MSAQPIPFDARRRSATSESLVPCAPEAEEAVLGSVLVHQDALLEVRGFLLPDMFHDERRAWIYAAMLAISDRREPPDYLRVRDELARAGKLDEVGGTPYLTRLLHETLVISYAEHYARMVERAARRRNLIAAASRIAMLAYDEQTDVDTVMDRAESALFDVTQRITKSDLRPLSVGIDRVFDRINKSLDTHAALGVPTGLRDFDRLTGGLLEDEYIVVAAPPSMGKSAFIGKIAKHVAGMGLTTAVFSLEMGIRQWAQRYLSTETGIDQHRIRLVNLNEADVSRLDHAAGPLSALPLYIDDTPDLTPNELRAKARRLHARLPLSLIIVDYAQLMTDPSNAGQGRVLELEGISRSLKSLARELGIPLLVASQVSRGVTNRDNKRAQLSDTLGSGAFERDADMWITLHRESYYQEVDEPPDFEVAEVIIRKNRNGPVGKVNVGWRRKSVEFVDLEPGDK